MNTLIQKTEVRKSRIHGWGVFATKDIEKGKVIEQCPFLITFGKNHKKMQDYLFLRDSKTGIIILGYGCLYNHSKKYNVEYLEDTKNELIEFVALKNIKKGEELFINYGNKYFTERGMKIN